MWMAAPLIVPLTQKRPFTERDAAFLKNHLAHPFPNQEVQDFFSAEWKTFNLLPELSRIKCPTLILSDADPLVGIEDAQDMVAAMPKRLVQHEHFPEAGHSIVGDSPDQFLCRGSALYFALKNPRWFTLQRSEHYPFSPSNGFVRKSPNAMQPNRQTMRIISVAVAQEPEIWRARVTDNDRPMIAGVEGDVQLTAMAAIFRLDLCVATAFVFLSV